MSQQLKVIAIDPGEKVGWATGSASPDGLELLDHGINSLKPFALKLGEVLSKYDVLIYETWRLFAGQAKSLIGDDMQTSQMIGMIRYMAWQDPNLAVVEQSPSIKKTADKTAILMPEIKDLFDREPGKHDDAHDIDAIRHLWYWYWKTHIKEA